LTQLARWGITPFPRNWVEVLERTHRLDVYREATRQLGYPTAEHDREPFQLFDGKIFNPDDPIGYLNSFEIHKSIRIEEVILDAVGKVTV
jgi:nitrate/nitrite transport system ATP-binding protein